MALVRTTNSVGPSLASALVRRWDVVEFTGEEVKTLLRDVPIWEAADAVHALAVKGRHAMVVQHGA